MKDIDAVWQEMLSILEVEVHSLGFDVWIRPLRPLKVEDGILALCAPSDGAKAEVIARYLPLLKRAMREVEGAPAELTVISEEEAPKKSRRKRRMRRGLRTARRRNAY